MTLEAMGKFAVSTSVMPPRNCRLKKAVPTVPLIFKFFAFWALLPALISSSSCSTEELAMIGCNDQVPPWCRAAESDMYAIGGAGDAVNVPSITDGRQQQRVALLIVGASRSLKNEIVHMSILHHLIGPIRASGSDVRVFFSIAASLQVERKSGTDGTYHRIQPDQQLCATLKLFSPSNVRVLLDTSCTNSSARQELACCNSSRIETERARRVEAEAPPLDIAWHAHGLLQYYHLRQCFRDVEAYEQRQGVRFDYFVRLRPDVAVTRPLPAPLSSLSAQYVHFDGFKKSGPKWKPSLKDWFFVAPKQVAHSFFEQTLVQSVEQFAPLGRAWDSSRGKYPGRESNCLAGPVNNGPESGLTQSMLKRQGFRGGPKATPWFLGWRNAVLCCGRRDAPPDEAAAEALLGGKW